MDLKDGQQRSLTRGPCRKDMHYATCSLDNENCHVVSQKSYSSSKRVKAYQQDGRLRYGGCVAELVHQQTEEYVRQGKTVTVINILMKEIVIVNNMAAIPQVHPISYISTKFCKQKQCLLSIFSSVEMYKARVTQKSLLSQTVKGNLSPSCEVPDSMDSY